MEALGNLGINIGYLTMQILGILVLYAILKHFAWGPIVNTLEARKERIAKGLEDARQAAQARDNAEAQANQILDEARSEAAKIRQDAAGQAEEQAKRILADANEEAKGVMVSARTDAEGERNRILSELRGQVASISMAAANKIVGESLDEKRQRALISDFFSKVPDGVSGTGKAVVTSALPLTDAEATKVKKAIGADDVEFNVNPNILGGLIVRVGDQIVDNSVVSQMNDLGSSLK